MRKLWVVVSLLIAVAVTAGPAGARLQAPSGDTCTFSGSGTTYTVDINAATSTQQFGFAFGAPGLTVTQTGIAGQNGNFTTAKLPANTTGAWISDTQLTGSLVATLTVSGTATGPVVIVPSAATQSSYYDPVTCTASTSTNTGGATAKNLSFTVASRATWNAAAHGWHLVVTIPTAGTVSAKQPLATSLKVKPKPLVQVKREALSSRGKVTLLVKTTPQGDAVLTSKNVLAVKLTITVDSRDGREAHKNVRLTLRK